MTLAPAAEGVLRAIVGSEHVRPADQGDAVRGVAPRLVVEPGTEEELAAVLRHADEQGLVVVPRGGGTKLEWGNPPARADVVLSLARLNRVLEHAWADLTVTVEAGCSMAHLQQTLAQHNQRLAVDVLWPGRATVGGVLSANESGALRLRYGGLRDLVIGVTLALADGTLAASGGKVVKNVAGYDLPKLATGALGTLGVITRATFRLHPLPPWRRSLTIRVPGMGELQPLVLAVLDSQLVPSALQVRLGTDTATEVDVLLEGTESGVAAQEADLRHLVGGRFAIAESSATVWTAREALWPVASVDVTNPGAVAKLSILPSHLARTLEDLNRLASVGVVAWEVVGQATGIGWLRLDGAAEAVAALLSALRAEVEQRAGSLVVLRLPGGVARLDAWGRPGDALPLMRALKQQLDPQGTLNSGRFVGGI